MASTIHFPCVYDNIFFPGRSSKSCLGNKSNVTNGRFETFLSKQIILPLFKLFKGVGIQRYVVYISSVFLFNTKLCKKNRIVFRNNNIFSILLFCYCSYTIESRPRKTCQTLNVKITIKLMINCNCY